MSFTRTFLAIACVAFLSSCDAGAPKDEAGNNATALQQQDAQMAENADVSRVTAVEEVTVNDECGINAPTPGAEYDRTKVLSVWGYAYDKASQSLPEMVSVRIRAMDSQESIVAPAQRGARQDIAEALGNPALANSGFGVELDVSTLPAGQYMVSVLQEVDDETHVCNNPLPITLR